MYKYLLCWRYLKTRYIALASVVSVMLGVATMIVVNSVMAGFADKMRDRLHGVLADVVVESFTLDGFYNSEEVMARVKQVAGDEVIAMAPTMETPGHPPLPVSQRRGHHPAGPDHRHQPRGPGQDRRLRRVPLRRPGASRSLRRSRSPRSSRMQTPAGQMLKDFTATRTTSSTRSGRSSSRQQIDAAGPRPRARSSAMPWRPTTGQGHEDIFLAPPGTQGRPALSHGPARPSRRRASTRSPSSATSRAA